MGNAVLLTSMFQNVDGVKLIIAGVAIIVGAILIVTYVRNRSIENIRSDVYQLFLKAEHIMQESGSGPERLDWVVDKAYALLPAVVQLFVTKSMLKVVFNNWFKDIKDLLDDGKKNGSTEITETIVEENSDN